MKKPFLLFILAFGMSFLGWGQVMGDFRSNASGNWNDYTQWYRYDGSTWVAAIPGQTPSATSSVYIQSGHTMTLTQNEACNDLNISTGTTSATVGSEGVVALTSFTLEINGKLRCYFASVGIVPGTSTITVGPAPITITASSDGKLKFVGNNRNIVASGEWGAGNTASSTTFPLEISMNTGQTATMQVGIKAQNWVISSGTLDAGINRISPDNGNTGGGNVTVNSGTTFVSSATGTNGSAVIGRTSNNTTGYGGTLIVNGTLKLSGLSPTFAMSTISFNGLVEYDRSGSQTLAVLTGGASGANIGIYNNLIFSASGVKTLGGNTTVNGTLTINTSNTLNVPAGNQLSVTGTTAINGGLVLKSPTGIGPTGSFLPTGAVSGSVTVERYIPQYTSDADGWYFLSSPVLNPTINGNFIPGTNDDVYRWDETVTDYPWINYKGPSPFTTFNSGEGYLVAYQVSAMKSFTGSLNQSDITLMDQTYTGASTWSGWHLLGNPYSCAVQWNDGNWALSDVEAIAQIMNSGGTYTSRIANDPIPAMNGFMVHVTTGTNSMTIPLAARMHSGIDWMKSTVNTQDKLLLTAISTDNTTYVETIVRFNPEADPAFDMDYDGHFLIGIALAPQLYSIVGDEHLCVNTLPRADNTRTVHLGFVKGSSVNYTLNVTGLESFNPGVSVFLEDTKASKIQDLRQSSVYSFSAAEGDNTHRFLLHFGGPFVVNELNKDSTIQIYAYNNMIYVANNGGQQSGGLVFVYNLMGQQLMQQELGDNKLTTFNLSGVTGYYLVKVITSENAYSGKVFLR